MTQDFDSAHFYDANGNPAGGQSFAVGISINWQNGPLCVDGTRKEPNGAFVETVLAIARDRLKFYQQGKFNCEKNTLAIDAINEALRHLNERTADREARGVEGTHAV